jgi:hypothetical protein
VGESDTDGVGRKRANVRELKPHARITQRALAALAPPLLCSSREHQRNGRNRAAVGRGRRMLVV